MYLKKNIEIVAECLDLAIARCLSEKACLYDVHTEPEEGDRGSRGECWYFTPHTMNSLVR